MRVFWRGGSVACVVALRLGAARLDLRGDGTLRAALLPWIGAVAPAVAGALLFQHGHWHGGWIGLAAGLAVLVLQTRHRWRRGACA